MSVRKSCYVFEHRITFLGAARVGKSSIINQFIEKDFLTQYSPTSEHHLTYVIEHRGREQTNFTGIIRGRADSFCDRGTKIHDPVIKPVGKSRHPIIKPDKIMTTRNPTQNRVLCICSFTFESSSCYFENQLETNI